MEYTENSNNKRPSLLDLNFDLSSLVLTESQSNQLVSFIQRNFFFIDRSDNIVFFNKEEGIIKIVDGTDKIKGWIDNLGGINIVMVNDGFSPEINTMYLDVDNDDCLCIIYVVVMNYLFSDKITDSLKFFKEGGIVYLQDYVLEKAPLN